MELKSSEKKKYNLELDILKNIGTNIIVIKDNNEFNFKKFINDEEINTVSIEKEFCDYRNEKSKNFNSFYKVEVVKGIYQILFNKYNKSPIYLLSDKYSYSEKPNIFGYYSSYKNCFFKCYCFFDEESELNKINFEDIEIISYYDFFKAIDKEINENIANLINDDIKNLNLDEKQEDEYREYISEEFIGYCKQKAYDTFVKNGNDTYYMSYANYKLFNSNDFENELKLIYSLYDKDNLIKNEVENFVKSEANKIFIYKTIVENEYVNKYIEELKQDKEAVKLREIYQILNDDSRKTLNIIYIKNDINLSFKIKGNSEIIGFKKIYSYNIINKSDRDLFDEKFKNEDIELEYIHEINYGRTNLYHKDN